MFSADVGVDTIELQPLLRTVWSIIQKRLGDSSNALAVLKSMESIASQNDSYRRIEEDFEVERLSECADGNASALPFLNVPMNDSYDHTKLKGSALREERVHNTVYQLMAKFWEELEEKARGKDKIVDNIKRKAATAADSSTQKHPESLVDAGIFQMESWKTLRREVDRTIQHVQRHTYSEKSLENIYSRLINKGLTVAREIQTNASAVQNSAKLRK